MLLTGFLILCYFFVQIAIALLFCNSPFLMRTLCGSFGSELCINGMDKMSRHTIYVC